MPDSYLKIKEREILNQLQFLKLIAHPKTKGDHLEDLLIKFLETELPKKYSVGSGFVIGLSESQKNSQPIEAKNTSKELDVVIFDEQINPLHLRMKRKNYFYAESIYTVISVKTRLDKGSLIKGRASILKNLGSAKKILPHSHSLMTTGEYGGTFDSEGGMVSEPIISVGFAAGGIKIDAAKEYLDNMADEYGNNWYEFFPDILVILGKGLLVLEKNNSTYKHEYKVIKTQDGALEEFFIQLLKKINNRHLHPVGLSGYKNFA